MLRKIFLVLVGYCFLVSVSIVAYSYTEKSGDVSGETWAAGTYLVTGSLTVNDGKTLTVNAGAVVKFNPNLQMTVYGTLDVNGAEENNVVFTSTYDDEYGEDTDGKEPDGGEPSPGDWYGIHLNGYDSYDGIGQFDWGIIRYAGDTTTDYAANVYFNQSNSGHFQNSISEYSAQDGMNIYLCSPTIQSSAFAHNTRHGVYASGGGVGPILNSNTFTNNVEFGAKLDDIILIDYSGNSGSGNGVNGVGVSGNVDANRTWSSPSDFPFVLDSKVTVNDGRTLTLSEGTIVKGTPTGEMLVYGTLNVNGASGNPVVFTSLRDDDYGGDTNNDGESSGSPGDWYGIHLNGEGAYDGIGQFDWGIIRYAGDTTTDYAANVYFNQSHSSGYFHNSISEYSAQEGVNIYFCSPTLTRSIFADNARHGLYASDSSTAAIITDNTFKNNSGYGAYLDGVTLTSYSGNVGDGNGFNGFGVIGTVTANQTWSGDKSFPFILPSTVTVNDGRALTLAPWTIIKGGSTGQLIVNGTLNVNGTSGKPVVFTSLLDDSFGGDTNSDGSTTSPSPGDWYGIYLNGYSGYDGVGHFDWCLVRYGGHPDGDADANLYFNESNSGYFQNSISEYSAQDGVKVYNCPPQFRGNNIENNTRYGIYISGSKIPDLGPNNPEDQGKNTFRGNDSGNYQVYNASANTVNAYYNFWVYITEPEIDAHIYGQVLFEPWLDDEPIPPVTYYAVIVGVADYPGTANDLDYPDDDAIDMKNSLLLYSNWEDKNIQLLLDASATKGNIQTAVEDMSRKMSSPGDVYLFFFSGRGSNVEDQEPIDEADGLDEYICSYGSGYDEWIRDDELSSWLSRFPTTNVFVIVDTSFSGGQIDIADGFAPKTSPNASGIVSKGDGFAADITRRISVKDMDDDEGCVVLSACDDDELAWESDRLENSLLTYFVVSSIEKNKDRDGNGELAAEEVGKYAKVIVNLLSQKLPFLDQHPQLYDDFPAGKPNLAELAVCIGEPQSVAVIHDEEIEDIIGLAAPTIVAVPKVSKLLQNYSNPFNPDTWIPYQLAEDADVTIKIYNITGQLVRSLNLGHKQAGFYLNKDEAVYWDGKNETGEKVASGIYFYQLQAGNFTATGRMLMLK